jgi:hypothetical protein
MSSKNDIMALLASGASEGKGRKEVRILYMVHP